MIFGKKIISGKAVRIASVTLVMCFIAVSLLICTAYDADAKAAGNTPAPSVAPSEIPAQSQSPSLSVAPSATPAPAATVEPVYEVKSRYAVGDVAPLGNLLVQVTNYGALQGSDYEKPEDGNEFVIATVVIKNNGTDVEEYSKYDFNMTDGNGSAADHRMLLANKDTALCSGELAPGGIVTGTLAFEEPVKASGLTLIYSPSDLGGKSAVFDMANTGATFVTLQKGDICMSGEVTPFGCAACLNGAAVNARKAEKSVVLYDKPKNGYDYITVTLWIENTGNTDLSYSPYYFNMMNSMGQISDVVITSVNSGSAFSSGILRNSETAEGTIVFEEPTGDTGLKLIYNSQSGGEKLIFPLDGI